MAPHRPGRVVATEVLTIDHLVTTSNWGAAFDPTIDLPHKVPAKVPSGHGAPQRLMKLMTVKINPTPICKHVSAPDRRERSCWIHSP